jgi:CBS domain-containing protein
MLKLRDIMTQDVVVVSSDMTLRRALELFAQRHITGAPVVEGKRVVGVVSASDLLTFVATTSEESEAIEPSTRRAEEWDELSKEEAAGLPDVEEEDDDEPSGSYFTELWSAPGPDAEAQLKEGPLGAHDVFEEHTVEEAMTREVCQLAPDASVTVAADYMRRANVHRILVLSGGELAGIVTTMDITRAVADRKIAARTYVFSRKVGG